MKYKTSIILNNISNRDLFIFFIFIAITLILSILTLITIKRINYLYLYFSIVSLLLIINSLLNKNIATFILNTFFYLGFFFKMSCVTIISSNMGLNIFFEESLKVLDFNSEFFQEILLKLSLFFSIFLITEIIISKRFRNIILIKKKDYLSNISKSINKYSYFIIIILLLFSLLINYLNIQYGITYRGKITSDNLISNFIKALNFFITSSIICLIIDMISIEKNKKVYLFILVLIFASIFNHLSILSRSGIFEILVILFVMANKNIKLSLMFVLLATLLWVFSFNIVNDMRNSQIHDKEINYSNNEEVILNDNDKIKFKDKEIIINSDKTKNYEYEKSNLDKVKENTFSYLLIYRWTGIDSFINTELNNSRNAKIFFRALNEDYKYGQATYYEKNFFKIPDKTQYNQTFIPGIIAFLNYSGNNTFFYFSAFLLSVLVLYLQKFIFILTNNLKYFSSFLVYVLIWRLVHFGISPINTLKYFCLIIVYIIFIRILLNIIKHKVIYKD